MRILVATPDFPPAPGGIQVLIERLCRELTEDEVVVACPDQLGAAAFDATLPFAVRRVPALGSRRASILRLCAEFPRIARAVRPEVILAGHIVCAPAAHLAAHFVGAPVIQYVYAMEVQTRAPLARWALRHADHTIAISRYTEQLAVAAGADPARIALVVPGVDPPPGPFRPDPVADPRIITIARLDNRYKGIDVMLRAFPLVLARVPDARWTIIGDGRLRSELEATSVRAGLADHVAFVGKLSDAERDARLAASRLFVMPSRVPTEGAGEGFGIVYLEAGRFAVPSVAGDEGGGAEAVLHGETGVLVDARDHLALAEAVTDLLVSDERCACYGAGAYTRATELSWARMAAGVRATLQSAVAQ